MSANSKIEWTDHTFNPWIGCTKVSPACDHCYAERSTPSRTLGIAWGPHAERHRTSDSNWELPKRWNARAFYECTCCGWRGFANDPEYSAPRQGCIHDLRPARARVFCASLADVFDNAVDREWRDDLATLILDTPNLDWLMLTKRIGNAGQMLGEMFLDGPPDNVWLGATIANQEEADRDIPKLLAVPAAKRFLSMEPLLGPVDLTSIDVMGGDGVIYPLKGTPDCVDDDGDLAPDLPALDWVIVGGESGANARPMHPDWARSLRDQCRAASVPFFFKQWGEWVPADNDFGTVVPVTEIVGDVQWQEGKRVAVQWLSPNSSIVGHSFARIGKKAAGRLLDGREWNEVPR